jgi:branched-chain amino acid transport system ATP-binding protein
MLQIENVCCHFGGLIALDDVSFQVKEDEMVGLMGPNGAGKTTLFNVITSFLPPTKGRICFQGKEITHLKPHEIIRKGLARTFQDIRIFEHLTVRENVEVAVPESREIGLWAGMFPTSGKKLILERIRSKALESLGWVGLSEMRERKASSLNFGQQRLLGIARALSCRPDIVLLDDPSSVLNPCETDLLVEIIKRIQRKGVAFLVIEHDIRMLMNLVGRLIVLDRGRKIMEGTPREVREEKAVIEAYFGKKGNQWLN